MGSARQVVSRNGYRSRDLWPLIVTATSSSLSASSETSRAGDDARDEWQRRAAIATEAQRLINATNVDAAQRTTENFLKLQEAQDVARMATSSDQPLAIQPAFTMVGGQGLVSNLYQAAEQSFALPQAFIAQPPTFVQPPTQIYQASPLVYQSQWVQTPTLVQWCTPPMIAWTCVQPSWPQMMVANLKGTIAEALRTHSVRTRAEERMKTATEELKKIPMETAESYARIEQYANQYLNNPSYYRRRNSHDNDNFDYHPNMMMRSYR